MQEGIQQKVAAVEKAEGAGARVKRAFPTARLREVNPFTLLDEFFVDPSAGFPDHPHSGFEALTYMLDGAFHHRDDMGNDRTVSAGGVQRFAAGRGIVHAEMPGGDEVSHGLQLWVDLPPELKEMAPDYQQVAPEAIPEREAAGIRMRVVVGEGSPVELHTSVRYLDLALEPGATFEDQIESGWRAFVYVIEGTLTLNSVSVAAGEAATLGLGADLKVASEDGARFALIAGEPHA